MKVTFIFKDGTTRTGDYKPENIPAVLALGLKDTRVATWRIGK